MGKPGAIHTGKESDAKPKNKGMLGGLLFLAVAWLFQLAAGAFVLSLMYGVAVIIFRNAFHVELWNPFH
jgi:hypothetical protein